MSDYARDKGSVLLSTMLSEKFKFPNCVAAFTQCQENGKSTQPLVRDFGELTDALNDCSYL